MEFFLFLLLLGKQIRIYFYFDLQMAAFVVIEE